MSGGLLLLLLISAVFADLIAPYDPIKNNVGPILSDPSAAHPFGTDIFGRDVLSRVVHGGRTSLYVGFVSTLIGLAAATVIGAVSGYASGAVDYVLQRLIDTVQAIPPLIFLIGMLIILGAGTFHVVLALGLRTAFSLSRVIRGTVIDIKSHQYLEAARAIGASPVRILVLHIIPNITSVIIVLFSTTIGGLILAEASLSFLGFGVPPPDPSWGGMMSTEARAYMIVAPWLMVAPTVALSIVVFATNMFGDAVRDELDPRLRGT